MYARNHDTIINYVYIFIIIDCPIWFAIQPPTELECNPKETFIALYCTTRATTNSVAYNVTWYWSQCVNDAGTKGTAILLENNRDEYLYTYYFNYRNTEIFRTDTIFFRVTESTQGYYWCEISSNTINESFRPSLIAPVLQSTNKSLPEFSLYGLYSDLYNVPECATKGSPTNYTQISLPSFCAVSSIYDKIINY